MLSRDDFIFTIGYDGPVAVVDKQAKNRYGKLSTRELAEKGLFRSAYSSAVYLDNKEELKYVLDTYKDLAGADMSSPDRLFGVFPTNVKRCISL